MYLVNIFLKIILLSNIVSDAEGYKTVVDFVFSTIEAGTTALLNEFFQIIETRDTTKGFLVHKFTHTFSPISIYSFLFFQKLIQGGKIDIDNTLLYSGTHGATATINVIYQQYSGDF